MSSTTSPTDAVRRMRYDEPIGRASGQHVHGRTILIAALDDVIASTEWADRPKDKGRRCPVSGLEAARELIHRRPRPRPGRGTPRNRRYAAKWGERPRIDAVR